MFSAAVKIEDTTARVRQAADKAAYRNLGHAAASIRKQAKGSIKRSPSRKGAKRRGGKRVRRATHEGSPPGQPPYTQRGDLPRAILFDVDKAKESAVIGAAASRIGTAGEPHEHGGEYKGADYEARPFMQPALEDNADRFAADWQGSIGE